MQLFFKSVTLFILWTQAQVPKSQFSKREISPFLLYDGVNKRQGSDKRAEDKEMGANKHNHLRSPGRQRARRAP
ncbi:MAG: hypothetical protein BYD32DRAFT_407685 [Podila humilis]|nr:MAG: hypothetical protein BYD32DRAFT_407685 [Podila humilis]